MSRRHFTVAAGQTFRRAGAMLLLLASSVAPDVAARNAVPTEFQGTWVPVKATCESPTRMLVAADRLTLANGKDSAVLGDIEMAGPGYWGPDYRGIMAVLITEFSGHQPVIVSFNFGEKKGAAQIEFSPVMPGNATAQSRAYNAHISKLNLARRFPLNKVTLKKCAGGPGAAPAR